MTRVGIDNCGRLTLPATFRRALGIKPGDRVHVRIEDGELCIYTWQQAVNKVQRAFVEYRAADGEELASEALIRERRNP